jgi:hypothetical protein
MDIKWAQELVWAQWRREKKNLSRKKQANYDAIKNTIF